MEALSISDVIFCIGIGFVASGTIFYFFAVYMAVAKTLNRV